jgi:DMSO/TMAO reductase YedYZ molybdopterin-dependent catalytic subunit
MRRSTVLPWALAGAVAGLAATLLVTVLRLVAGVPLPVETVSDRLLPLVPVDLFLAMLGRLGGPIIAKELAYASGFVLPAVLGAAAGAALSRTRRPGRALAGLLTLLGALLLVALWPALAASYTGRPPELGTALAATGLVAALALAGAIPALARRRSAPPDTGRRTLLILGAGGLLAAATGLGAAALTRRGAFGYDGTVLRGPVAPITPVGSFYVVTKNLIDPDVAAGDWRLTVRGLVTRPFTIDLAELRGLGRHTQETALECISNGVGYGLLSNAVWTGAPLAELLARAAPGAGAAFVGLRAADGYTYGLSLDEAHRPSALVAHAMNGVPLPARHGFPARLVLPGRYGEASVKWLTEIEVRDEPLVGYYERQGWRSEHVQTMSRIDSPPAGARLARTAGAIPVHGVAFAGDRGVRAVELSDDGGLTWRPARLTYAPSALAWTLWQFDWTPAGPGSHELRVRATDGNGALQDARPHGFAPSGATGEQVRRVTVSA